MSDIELVIKIPENAYKATCNGWMLPTDVENVVRGIKNGIPLPEGHGDLKDANKLKHAFITWSMAVHGNFTDADIASIIYNSPTIVEVDKESEERENV